MKTDCAAFIGLMSILLLTSSQASAQSHDFSGVSTRGNLSVWRIDHSSGTVSLCGFEGRANKPICYPWSAEASGTRFDIIPGDDVLSTWRINRSTGSVSLCEYEELSDPPRCTPWSEERPSQ